MPDVPLPFMGSHLFPLFPLPEFPYMASKTGPFPPSVLTVVAALQEGAPLTSGGIQAATGLQRRTVYASIRVLRGAGLLTERPSLRDMRQTYISLKDGAPGIIREMTAAYSSSNPMSVITNRVSA